jgi:hypothetical protein
MGTAKSHSLNFMLSAALQRARDALLPGKRRNGPVPVWLIPEPDGGVLRELLIRLPDDMMLDPTWIIAMPDGTLRQRVTPFPSDTTDAYKDKVAAAMGTWMRESGAVAYAFVFEAWTSASTAGRASEADDRIETVIANAENLDGEQRSGAWKIIRNEAGGVSGFELIESVVSDNITLEGRFSGLLKKPQSKRWWTAEDDPRDTFLASAETLEKNEREGLKLSSKDKAELAALSPGAADAAERAKENVLRVGAAYRDLVERMKDRVYPCGRCGEGGKFNFGSKPKYAAFVIPWMGPEPELDNVMMAPVCEACAAEAGLLKEKING